MYTFIGAPNPTPTLNLPTSEQYKHVTGKYKYSHRYLLQKLTIKSSIKALQTNTNKSCCIPSLLKPYDIFMHRRE